MNRNHSKPPTLHLHIFKTEKLKTIWPIENENIETLKTLDLSGFKHIGTSSYKNLKFLNFIY